MIVYTGGTFDLLHVGHLELLAACRELAGPIGSVVVALNRDEFVVTYKRRAPVQSYAERKEVLQACRFVDLVVCNVGDGDSKPALDVIRPDVIAIGDDWLGRDYMGQLGIDPAFLAERHLSIEYVPRTRGVSTTGIRGRLAA